MVDRSHEKIMNAYNKARATLFRAILGEEPIPSAAEVAQARALLKHDPEFRAGLDELVSVILLAQHPKPEQARDQLQAYVAAQLTGQTALAEFAALRRQLDANVALSEEYALLYETMQREQQGTLSIPQNVPPLNLNFLPVATQAPAERTWRQTIKRLKVPPVHAVSWSQLFRVGRLYPLAAGLFLCIALSFGIWRVAHPAKLVQVERTANHVENRAQPSAFFKLQMQIETASPSIMITQFYETPEVVGECPQMRQLSFVRNICKM